MRKIPTIFLRDDSDRAHVTTEPNPDCEWVFDGLGIATRKYDGTCMMFDGTRWWARREVKPGMPWPPEFDVIEVDRVTHKAVGWIPAEFSSFAKFWREAIAEGASYAAGTYELIGPRINGNPDGVIGHTLVRHAEDVIACPDRTHRGIREVLDAAPDMEGLVFWRTPGDPDSAMAKIKRKDFA